MGRAVASGAGAGGGGGARVVASQEAADAIGYRISLFFHTASHPVTSPFREK